MPSDIYRTASSSVVAMKDGRFLEIRRGDLRGAKINDKQSWATIDAWISAVGEPLLLDPVTPPRTPDQVFIKAKVCHTSNMRKYNPAKDVAKLQRLNELVSRLGSYKRLEHSILSIKKLIDMSATHNYYVAPKSESRLYVCNADNFVMHPIYYNDASGLIGLPDPDHIDIHDYMILKTGRSFEELGLSPCWSYWYKDRQGSMRYLCDGKAT